MALTLVGPFTFAQDKETITVGSKMDGESYLLAEIMSQLLESDGYIVDRRFGMGGTLITYNALTSGEIDLYPEYTGTITAALLSEDELSDNPISIDDLNKILNDKDLHVNFTFGFNNTYAMAIKRELSDEKGIKSISDLQNHPDLNVHFSHEFLNRNDGWPALKAAYGLSYEPTGIQHGLAYKAIDEDAIDMTDAYSTDGDIERYGLILLKDDLEFFPKYFAASLTRTDFPLRAAELLAELSSSLNDESMRAMNAQVVIHERTFADVANEFLISKNLVSEQRQQAGWSTRLLSNTLTHIKITLIALSAGCVFALILAFLIFRSVKLSRSVIYFSGLMQTIPSIALLALMIPLFGIGELPAILALFLYSLLPILRSAVTALTTIDPVLVNVSRAIGMTRFQQLSRVIFPLALPNILSGIRTATIICIGTATLAAFIGAGGLGEPIVTGLALNDTNLILQGAVPAACLAIITELLFELLEKKVIPEHMRVR
ncbi:glycine betaine ABC transporter substrate-binding protein [Pseudemcibacter aquimaris]|uniref:glycine betaine ABC transporter substrate-binding protein n=1 Tax=Pseudemcibacter aquimaris TaxID=2857064 RepID=UPI002013B9CC|nr:glycine betaine ABC transporter substrate-binding protein [Pseudemcibacter aquimaris]MCC3861270.1 ABC transporter permease subunit [Pseudemcibacter aquimaris]WDU58044.1 ABC transporter permease subunit [Pseudemcibacter aquimaris]